MNSEILHEMTTVELAASRGNTVDLFRQRYAQFRREGNTLFAAEFRRDATLTVEQIKLLTATKSGRSTSDKKHEIRSVKPIDPVGSQATARPNEGGPDTGSEVVKLEREKAIAAANWAFIKRAHKERLAKKSDLVKRDWFAIGALALVFVMATVISGANTFKVSGQLSNSWLISNALMFMVSFTPILFIVARMEKVGVAVAVCVVVFEGFCNTAATYLSLMGGMVYVWGAPRGDCSPFLQNVVELTASGHKGTAVIISICLALLVSSVQLVSFWGLKKRF